MKPTHVARCPNLGADKKIRKQIIRMTTFLKTFFVGAMLVWSFASCSSDADLQGLVGTNEVTFTTAPTTKAVGAQWTAGDRIGVYMKTAGATLEGSALTGSNANVSYTTTAGDGVFTASSTALYYPHDGSAVDFIAYYPYTSSVSAGVYTVNLTTQSDAEAIDLMYANNLTSMTKDSGAGALAFSHKLATVQLTLKSADGQSLDGITATVKSQPTTGEFNIATGDFGTIGTKGDIAMKISGSGTTLTASALLLPTAATEDLKPLTVSLTNAVGKTSTVTLSDNLTLTSGQRYTYTINITAGGGSTVTPSYTSWTETPTITAAQLNSDHIRYVTHNITVSNRTVRNYSLLYDTQLKMAYWVAYPLCNFYVTRNTSRTNVWGADPSFTSTEQADFSSAIGGYQRGHQIPSADRYVSDSANIQTFYYTNMTPQDGDLNTHIWADLEGKVRSWSSNIDTLYVVTGASPTTSTTSTDIKYAYDVSGQAVAVPKYYYKALARIDRETGTAYTIAFKFNNERPSSSTIMDYALSVAELEELTGFTFFPTIDASYKQSYDATKWQ